MLGSDHGGLTWRRRSTVTGRIYETFASFSSNSSYFANNLLATLPSRVKRLREIDTLPVEIPDEAFATV